MWREETNSEECETGSETMIRTVRTNNGTGGQTTLFRTPAWATEHIEHSWLGSLEFSG